MSRVYLSQLKCPSNHCVLALAGEYRNLEEAEGLRKSLLARMDVLVDLGKINRKCDICDSTELHADLHPTRYQTLEEALNPLRMSEADQRASAAWLKRSKN